MKVVPIRKLPSQLLRQRSAHRRLPSALHAHYKHDHALAPICAAAFRIVASTSEGFQSLVGSHSITFPSGPMITVESECTIDCGSLPVTPTSKNCVIFVRVCASGAAKSQCSNRSLL